MAFRYFQDPHRFSTYTDEGQACHVCNQVGPGYKPPFYGRQRIEFVCEGCLLAGKLAEARAFTNNADVASLRKQLAQLHPELDEAQVQQFVQERTAELEHRTPHLVTWQDFAWPVHCGDYCRFVKEVGKPDLNGLAPDGDGQAFFAQHLRERDRDATDVPTVWKAIRPDSPQVNSTAYSVGVYLFQCLHCQEYVILWDCD